MPLALIYVFEGANLLFQLNTISFLIAMLGGYLFATSGNLYKKAAYVLVALIYCSTAVLFLAERMLHYDNFKIFEGYTLERVKLRGI